MTIDAETLLDDLEDVSREVGRPPAFREYDDRGTFGACTIQRRFGGWNAALRAAGLDPTREYGVADESFLTDLRRVAIELGETPRVADYDKLGEYGQATIRDRFGGWNAALQAAGLDARHTTDITREDVAQDISRVASDLGRAPTFCEYDDSGRYSASTAVDRFGSWADAKANHDLVLVPTSTRGKYHAIAELDPPKAKCQSVRSPSGSFRVIDRGRADEHWDPCRHCSPRENPRVECDSDLRKAVSSASTVRDVAEELRIPYHEVRQRLSDAGLMDELLTAEEIIERTTGESD